MPPQLRGKKHFMNLFHSENCKFWDFCCFVEKAVCDRELEETKEELRKTKEELLLVKKKASRENGTFKKGKKYGAKPAKRVHV